MDPGLTWWGSGAAPQMGWGKREQIWMGGGREGTRGSVPTHAPPLSKSSLMGNLLVDYKFYAMSYGNKFVSISRNRERA